MRRIYRRISNYLAEHILYIIWYPVIIIAVLYFFTYGVGFFHQAIDISPEKGSYRLLYHLETDGELYYDFVFTAQSMNAAPVDLDNMEIATDFLKGHTIIFPTNVPDSEHHDAVRLHILENGYGKLMDPDIATAAEQEADNYAQRNDLGIWGGGFESGSVQTIPVQNSVRALLGHISTGFRYSVRAAAVLGISILGLATGLFQLTRGVFRKKKVRIYLWGLTASGKTAIHARLDDPDISSEEIRQLQPTHSPSAQPNQIRWQSHGDYELMLYCIDSPGDNYHHMLQVYYSKQLIPPTKNLILIVLSPTRDVAVKEGENCWNTDYVKEQVHKLSVLVKLIAEDETLAKVISIVLYINKCDLITKDEKDLLDLREEIIGRFREVEDFAIIESHTTAIILGSALWGWNYSSIKQQIERIYNKGKKT